MSGWAVCWSSSWPLRPGITVQGWTAVTALLLTFRTLCEHQGRMCFQCKISSSGSDAEMTLWREIEVWFALLLPFAWSFYCCWNVFFSKSLLFYVFLTLVPVTFSYSVVGCLRKWTSVFLLLFFFLLSYSSSSHGRSESYQWSARNFGKCESDRGGKKIWAVTNAEKWMKCPNAQHVSRKDLKHWTMLPRLPECKTHFHQQEKFNTRSVFLHWN